MPENNNEKNSPVKYLLFGLGLFILGGLTVLVLLRSDIGRNVSSRKVTSADQISEVKCGVRKSIDEAKSSVVRVIGDSGEGTGFVINKNGYILTNYHVVQDSETPKIVLSDKIPILGKLYNFDKQTDLAVIKIDSSDLKQLSFGDSDKLNVGSPLTTIGFPLGQALQGDATVTKGIYSAKRLTDVAGLEYIQVDANLNEGNSGSPVLDECGSVVGVLTLSINGAEGLKFAISSKIAKSISESLIVTGPKKLAESKQANSSTPDLTTPVFAYYDYISTRQLEKAFSLLSDDFQQSAGGLQNFINGYDSTLNVYLQNVEIDDSTNNAVKVTVASADLVGDKVLFRQFQGTWLLVNKDGQLKLDKASIKQI